MDWDTDEDEGAGVIVSKRPRACGEGLGVANVLCGWWGLLSVVETELGAGVIPVRPGKTFGLCKGADKKAGRGFVDCKGLERVRGGRL